MCRKKPGIQNNSEGKRRIMKTLSREEQEKIAKKDKLTQKDYKLIYESYYTRIFNFINARVIRREDAEDLASVVFERVLKKLSDFQWQGITITSWIFRIARNAIIDHYRKTSDRDKDPSIEQIGDFLVSNEEKIEQTIIDNEDEIKLYNAIREFKEKDQLLIYYKFFEDLSNKEIAEITGMTETNVGTRLHRIRSKIKDILEKN